MWKSPLSRPSGSGRKQSVGWKSQEDTRCGGYVYGSSTSESQTHLGNDFIPLGISTPRDDHRKGFGNWQRSGNNHSRQTSNRGYPNRNWQNTCTPYSGQFTNAFQTRNKGGQKAIHGEINISRYINLKYFLEDPWAEFAEKINQSEKDKDCQTRNPMTIVLDNVDVQQPSQDVKYDETLHDSGLSQESGNNTLEELGNNTLEESASSSKEDTNCSAKLDSSIDRKFVKVTVSDNIENSSHNVLNEKPNGEDDYQEATDMTKHVEEGVNNVD